MLQEAKRVAATVKSPSSKRMVKSVFVLVKRDVADISTWEAGI